MNDLVLQGYFLTSNIVTPGPTLICPVCKATLSNSVMGVNSHLQAHVRRGEVSPNAKATLRNKILREGAK